MLSLAGDGSAEALLATEFSEPNAEISPDGRWIAYQSNASGRDEIYVRPFPNVDEGRWQVSRDGGTRPLWAPDGGELFYQSSNWQLMAVRVETEPGFTPGNAAVLSDGRYFTEAAGVVGRTYDISPDGERFLMIEENAGGDSTEFILVLNWFQELERLVPTDN